MEPMKPRKGVDYTGVGVVFACHDGEGNFLLAKRGQKVRDEQGTWEIPAGGVKFGETIRDGLIRELKEELCVEPIQVEEMGYNEVIQKDGEKILKHWVVVEFLVEVDRTKVKIGEPDACEEIMWQSLERMPSPLRSDVESTLTNIRTFLKSKNY